MFTWRKHPKQYIKLLKGWLTGSEKGISTLEVLLAIVILGVVAIAFLSSIGTATQATVITREQSVAESLVRSEAEYVKGRSPYRKGGRSHLLLSCRCTAVTTVYRR